MAEVLLVECQLFPRVALAHVRLAKMATACALGERCVLAIALSNMKLCLSAAAMGCLAGFSEEGQCDKQDLWARRM